jgi:hypothetical protein
MDSIYARLKALREVHVYPSYRTTSDEAWGRDPICSCGLSECDIALMIDMLPEGKSAQLGPGGATTPASVTYE